MSLVCFPARAPAGVPAPKPGHEALGIFLGLFTHRTGFAGESLFSGFLFWVFIICSPYRTAAAAVPLWLMPTACDPAVLGITALL
jgi:hypothetical protein